jgi:hypothetical protein
MEALGLNEKGNKSKEKVVEEKEKSGMETVLNAFEKSGRGRGARVDKIYIEELTTTSSL